MKGEQIISGEKRGGKGETRGKEKDVTKEKEPKRGGRWSLKGVLTKETER